MSSLEPMSIFKQGADEEKSESARMSCFIGAMAIGDMIKTTLGPKGMDKILQSADPNQPMHVTNDGATIMRAVGVDNPAAKVLVDISKTQDEEVGDGTTSVVILTCELLREAEQLIGQRMHPQTIISGYRRASKEALRVLESNSVSHDIDSESFRKYLVNIAKTTLSSKILTHDKLKFAELAVDAVLRLKGSGNLESIQLIKKCGGTLADSYLEEGFLLDKKIGVNQPKKMANCKILVANTPMDTDKIKIFGSRVRVDAISKLSDIEVAEKEKMKAKVEKIVKHGCNVFINRQLIYNYPEQLFADAGVMAIEHADFEGVERLALVTGAEIVSTFDSPKTAKLGVCELIEEVIIGEDRLLKFSGVALGEACSIVIRGATQQILDEAERSLHDALCVLTQTVKQPRTVFGGGCMETLMANAVANLSKGVAGKEALAMDAYARALMQIPTIISDNAGYDSAELITQLRARHTQGDMSAGLDMNIGAVDDMTELGIIESYAVKRQVVSAASEGAEMILRVDDIIRAQPRPRQSDRCM